MPDATNVMIFMLSWLPWLLSVGTFLLVGLAVAHLLVSLIVIIPTWKIMTRAGFSGAWSLLHLVPVIGTFIVMAILAFGDWPNGEATR